MTGEPQTTRQTCAHKLIAPRYLGLLKLSSMRRDSVSDATTHIFKIREDLLDTAWGRSLGRYDDGLQKVANGFADLKRDEEVLELSEKPVGAAPKALFPGKGRRFKSGRPHQLPFSTK
jgi:hypothetical protein